MTRPVRIAFYSTAAVALLVAAAIVAGVAVARSRWFGEKVRERIVAEATRAVNGRVEIGSFSFDWHTLTAQADNVTIHGTEPAGTLPLLQIKTLVVGLKMISVARRTLDIARLELRQPRAHLMVRADGTISIPPPHTITPQDILNLKVRRFVVADGMALVEIAGRRAFEIPVRADAGDVTLSAAFDAAHYRYDGALSAASVDLKLAAMDDIRGQLSGGASLEKNRIAVRSATLKTADSTATVFEASLDNFQAPVITAKYSARISLGEVDRIFRLVNFSHSGAVNVSGQARFLSMEDYSVSGSIAGAGLSYSRLRNLTASGGFTATPRRILLSGLRLGVPGGEISGSGEVTGLRTFHVTGALHRFDSAALMSVAGVGPFPYDGLLSGPFDATGEVSERDFHHLVVTSKAAVSPVPGQTPLHGELDARFDAAAETISFGRSWLELPHTRVEFSGFPSRRLNLRLESSDLDELRAAIAMPAAVRAARPFAASFQGAVEGPLRDPRVGGHAQIRNALYGSERIDSAEGDFSAANSGMSLSNVTLRSNGLSARISGSVGLTGWRLTPDSRLEGRIQLSDGDVTKALTIARLRQVDLTGALSATGQVAGTWGDPHVNADLALAGGEIYGEPYDSLTGRIQYARADAQTFTATITAGVMRAEAQGELNSRRLSFSLSTNSLPLNRIEALRREQPDLRGSAQVQADGAVEIDPDWKGIRVVDLNGELSASSLALGTRNFGETRLTAFTRNGILNGRFTSNAANASISGEGSIALSADYPMNARMTLSNVRLNAVEALLQPAAAERNENFDGSLAGTVAAAGPAARPGMITATLDVSRFEMRPRTPPNGPAKAGSLVLRNDGPVRLTLARSVISVEQARFSGPDTAIEVLGTIAPNETAPLDLHLRGTVGLALAQTFSPDLATSGDFSINASARGSWTNPLFDGSAELRNGAFHYAGFANGLTSVNAVIAFSGTRANISSFAGETGGGKVTADGFAALSNGVFTFRVNTRAREVRVRYPEGVSSLCDGVLTFSGSSGASHRSEVSGAVTIRRVAINPKSDAAGMLVSSAEPMKIPAAGAGPLSNTNLNIQIDTARDVQFETSIAQSVQADASLRLRGTLTNPAVLGRINISEGVLNFFGNRYVVNQGTISFFNPAKIEPVVNVSLETKARGVDVVITISGAISKLNVSYRSDPPLQFGDIVALVATGRAPDSSGLVARNTSEYEAFQQLGASGLVDQALANTGSQGRLQRFFGVSGIKIDPQLSGLTGSPEARLSVEQQITPQLLFTYVSDISSTSTQLIRVEWDFNPRWGAILTREENGYVGLSFAWKKRFR